MCGRCNRGASPLVHGTHLEHDALEHDPHLEHDPSDMTPRTQPLGHDPSDTTHTGRGAAAGAPKPRCVAQSGARVRQGNYPRRLPLRFATCSRWAPWTTAHGHCVALSSPSLCARSNAEPVTGRGDAKNRKWAA